MRVKIISQMKYKIVGKCMSEKGKLNAKENACKMQGMIIFWTV